MQNGREGTMCQERLTQAAGWSAGECVHRTFYHSCCGRGQMAELGVGEMPNCILSVRRLNSPLSPFCSSLEHRVIKLDFL